MSRKCAFTLIELLVVMFLLSTLAAMLFPVFAQVRSKARQTTCASNLRQLGMAVGMYAGDYDDLYPWGVSVQDKYNLSNHKDPRLATMPLIHEVLASYVASKDLWRCPSDDGMVTDEWTFMAIPNAHGVAPSLFEVYGNSYDYRSELAFKYKLHGTSAYQGKTDLGPSRLALMGDSSGRWHGDGKHILLDGAFVNTLFGDGHVKYQSGVDSTHDWYLSLDPQ